MERMHRMLLGLVVAILPLFSCTQKLAVSGSPVIQREVAGEEVATNNVNGRILRQFYLDFGQQDEAKWYKSESGYRATVMLDGVLTRVYYKHGGIQECMIRYYFEDRLNTDVRHRVRSVFYDFAIVHVTEVRMHGDTAWHVKLESKNQVKTVRVSADAMEVTETLVKMG